MSHLVDSPGQTEVSFFYWALYELGRARRRLSYYMVSTYGYLMAMASARNSRTHYAGSSKNAAVLDHSAIAEGLEQRISYYLKRNDCFELSSAKSIQDLLQQRATRYVMDFLYYLRDHPTAKVSYVFGDVTEVPPEPAFVKSRPIDGPNENAVLFKLDKYRHFFFVNDRLNFSEKKAKLVWRGRIHHGIDREKRILLLSKYFGNARCDVAHVNNDNLLPEFKGRFLNVPSQLQYKYVMSLEGIDVGTNLKWIMSSNSLCFSPKLKYETWFMEGTLEPNVHYVQVADDFSDLDEKLDFFEQYPQEAMRIIQNAKNHVSQFLDANKEDLLCKLVLRRYLHLSKVGS